MMDILPIEALRMLAAHSLLELILYLNPPKSSSAGLLQSGAYGLLVASSSFFSPPVAIAIGVGLYLIRALALELSGGTTGLRFRVHLLLAVAILGSAIWAHEDTVQFVRSWRALLDHQQIYVLIVAYSLSAWPAGALVARVTDSLAPDESLIENGLPGAGWWIGVLERILIVSFIAASQAPAIAAIAAAKGAVRWADLSDAEHRKRAEYVLVGTLVSFGVAMALGVCVRLTSGT